MNSNEINTFTCYPLLKDMIVYRKKTSLDDIKIDMEYILNLIKENKINSTGNYQFEYDNDIYNLNIFYLTNHKFSFQLKDVVGHKLFLNPFEYYHKRQKYQFISEEQFEHFLKDFNCPIIECSKKKSFIEANIFEFRYHVINHNDKIIEGFHYKCLDEKEFNSFFSLKNRAFINKCFESPDKFEKNFHYYFDYNYKLNLNGQFCVFDDEYGNREFISDNLIKFKDTNVKYYFGESGQGKSITLIGTLKYRNDFQYYGSLYINCKTLKLLLEEQNYLTVKQILIDEILYLFPKDYKKYLSCVNYIKSIGFYNKSNYMNLVNNLIDNLDNNKNYLIAFDQYNDINDPDNILGKILLKNENKNNIKFLVFSSMNEENVRKIKMNKLFCGFQNNKYFEISSLCKINDKNLKTDEKNALDKLGGTFKAYIEIKNSNNIKEYLKIKRYKFTKKLISFYLTPGSAFEKYFNDKKKQIIQIPYEIIGKITSFKTDFLYNKNSLIEIIDYVPFRFFDIEVHQEKYKIKFSFPLIEEIMKEIYKIIALKYSFDYLKSILDDKYSSLDTLFEMKVIQHLLYNQNIFVNFDMTGHYLIQTIIPKKNEKKEVDLNLKLTENKTYIIEQKIFNGKLLDCLIIHMIYNEPFIFGFQISIFKENIYGKKELINAYEAMINNMENIFNIKIKPENTFFGYVFDYSRYENKDYDNVLKKCELKNWKYCFFDTKNNIFCDKNNKRIFNIYKMVCCPYNNFPVKYNISKYFKLENEKFDSKLKRIIEFLSEERNETIKNLKFTKKVNNIFLTKDHININDRPFDIIFVYLKDFFVFSKSLNKNSLEIIDYSIIPGQYDLYKIIY